MSIHVSTPYHHHLKGSSLHDLLREQTVRGPDAVAMSYPGGRLTFAELDDAAARLGARLLDLGVRTNTAVGLYTESSADLMIGAWGILSSGAAYLPLSPDYPDERIRYMVEDSGTEVVVTQGHLVERLRRLVPDDVTVVTTETTTGDAGTHAQVAGSDLAYVIYTSGSTGKPKGVMIEQHSIVSQIQWLATCGHLGPGVTILQKTPMSFDAAQWEILAPAAGAHVVVARPGSFRDPELLIDQIRAYGVTSLQAVPTLLQALVDTGRFGGCTSLTRVFSGGEPLTRSLAQDILRTLPSASLVNLYGPTETTINATSYRVDPNELADAPAILPIGIPVDKVTCYILDEQRRPVDIGETGELFVGGAQVARGYRGLPEQTAERFITSPFNPTERLYRTGDLARWSADGTIRFAGRTDNQVKLRGYRVELEEIASRIEQHTWVRRAAALVTDDARTGGQTLVAAIELNERTAAVMDQGRTDAAHHQSKASKLQVKAQLSNPGLRSAEELDGRRVVPLPQGRAVDEQRRQAFARKTYRFYDGGDVTAEDLLGMLAPRPAGTFSRPLGDLDLEGFGQILRWFGPFRSADRLLPKYVYASPGALYATQLYVELSGLFGLAAGMYYFHPVDHSLVRVGDLSEGFPAQGLRVHFLGKQRAVEPVYKNNIVEVLEFEAGHMLGVFEEILPAHGLQIGGHRHTPRVKARFAAADDDHYLGTFEISANLGQTLPDEVELFVQAHEGKVRGLDAGLYRYAAGTLTPVGPDVVERHHVIAINQSVYERAAFGISAVARTGHEWLRYLLLGRRLHQLQRAPGMGLMSSGYSSKSGNPLPASVRLDELLREAGIDTAPASYFFVGGRISEQQAEHEGMNEDAVHAKGPAEIVRDDLARFVPDYMVPARVLVVNELPLTANGKIDAKATAALPEIAHGRPSAVHVAPATATERWLAGEWGRLLKYEDISTQDEFFAAGGNSLHAVALVGAVNREFGIALPLQAVFEAPKLEDLAARIDGDVPARASRLVPLHSEGVLSPVFCWPGLGGYPMNLRLLSKSVGLDRPFYGVQARGINEGETPYGTIREMARADVAEIRREQPSGPYTLWGYSFGARVAFEAAWQLERAGEKVENLLLICPGNPAVRAEDGQEWGREASWSNPAYLTILFSVFTGTIHGPALESCLERVHDEGSFVGFVHELLPQLDPGTIRRITRIVGRTYEFEYSFRELNERTVQAPITILKAAGDDYSFLEGARGYSAEPPTVLDLAADHYGVLKRQGIAELVARVRSAMSR
ncbi:amino acid adenylation domain-containing protein [Streptomyces sp. NPDC007084]|uniref:non-ribosomal peptide synthetase family protein n=1 Tax=Streptomyces sp. NPDC007084 TaxID=3154313 RepID=UPI0034535685